MTRTLLCIIITCLLVPLASGVPQADRRGLNLIVVSTQAEAASLRNRIRAGESFELLAMRHSIGPSAETGGYFITLRAGDLRQELEGALEKLKPGQISPVENLGRLFFLLRRSTPAEDTWRSRYDAGLQLLLQHRYREAVESLSVVAQEATRLNREDPRIALSLQSLSHAYRLQHDYAHAETAARQSLTFFERLLGPEHPGLIPALENLAAITQAIDDNKEAEQLYRRILSIRWSGPKGVNPMDAFEVLEKLSAVLAAAYFKDSQLDETLRDFEQTIARAPLREDLYAGIAQGLFRVDLVTEAEAVARRGVQVFPDSRQLRYGLARIYVQASKYEAALNAFMAASRLEGPLDPAVDRQQLAVIHERIGSMNLLLVRFDDALSSFKTALRLSPNNLKTRLALADLYFRLGMMDEALSEYKRVTATNPESAAGYHGLADVYLHLEHFPEAVVASERSLELDPNELGSRYVHAAALLRAGRIEQGQKALQEYERLEAQGFADEKRRRTSQELDREAAMRLVKGQPAEAIAMWRQALDSHPRAVDTVRVFLNLGLALSRLGLHQEAAETFQSMLDQGISDFLIHRNLALQYKLLGDPRFAQQQALYLEKYDAALKVILN